MNNTWRRRRGRVVRGHRRSNTRPSARPSARPSSGTYPGDDLGLAFLPPLAHLGVDLLAHFRLDLSGVSREQRQEALRAAVDDVDLVEGHRVHHLFPLLELPFWTLYKLRLQKRKKTVGSCETNVFT